MVMIGSAHGDENGGATGGKAGDQTGRELSEERWYKSSKGWRVFRAKSEAARWKIGADMEMACANPMIGYDQNQRLTLYKAAEPVGFDCSKVTQACETDCSALVCVCCAYAGIMLTNFNTQTEPSVLLASGAFDELTGAQYTDSPDLLEVGDILCTRTKGHTAVVTSTTADGSVLRRGDKGADVKKLQQELMALGYNLPRYGADGDFGAETENAVKAFQKVNGLTADGEVGPATRAALEKAMGTRYTVTVRGLSKLEADGIKLQWPQAEVTQG